MVTNYSHKKRGSDDDTVALTTIDTIERQSSNSEPDYEYKQVKWKDYVTKKKYIRMFNSWIDGGVECILMRGSLVDFGNNRGCTGGVDVVVPRSDCRCKFPSLGRIMSSNLDQILTALIGITTGIDEDSRLACRISHPGSNIDCHFIPTIIRP